MSMNKSDLIVTRTAVQSDKPFILATWLKGLKFGNSWFKLIDDKVYFQVYHSVVETIITKPGVDIKVACLKEDPSVIIGYGVFEGSKIHWMHVKKLWRGIGVARDLIPPTITTATHLSDAGKSILLKRGWVFNPFLLY